MGDSPPVEPLQFCPYTHVGDASCTIDLNQRLVCWNPISAEVLGYSFDEVFGQKCWQTLCGETEDGRPHCQEDCPILTQVAQKMPVKPFNVRLRTKSGFRVLVNVSTVPIYNFPDQTEVVAVTHLMRLLPEDPDQMNCFRVRLLGPIEAQRPDGEVVTDALQYREKVQALLAYLALNYNQPVHRDVLLELLWSHLPYDSALSNLNTTVYNLRRSLEPDLKRGPASAYVVYKADSYRLTSDRPFWLDVTIFETTVSQARQAKNVQDAVSLYETACELYRGDYLGTLRDAEIGQLGEQVRLRELYLAALDELAAVYVSQGMHAKARDIYLQIMTKDSCREPSCLRLIELELLLGNRSAARHHCLRLRKALQEELDVKVDPAIETLCQNLE